MAAIKRIAGMALLGILGVVLYRFVRIVVRVLREKPAPRTRTRARGRVRRVSARGPRKGPAPEKSA